MSTRGAEFPHARSRRSIVRAIQLIAIVVGALGVASARVVVSGEREIAASTDSLQRADPTAAVAHARRAAAWYAPGAPHVRVAYDRLRALARTAEEHRRYDVALLAWRSIRSASLETRSILEPRAADRDLADREIARLTATEPNASGLPGDPDEQVAAAQLAAAQTSVGPRLVWAVVLLGAFCLAVIGMLSWAGQLGAALAVGRTAKPAERLWRRGRGGMALTLLGLVLWVLALWQA